MYIEYDLVALRRLYKEFRIKQTVLARWIGVSRQNISQKIKSESNSTVSWQDETLDNGEMNILLNMIKNGQPFDQNNGESLIVNIGINYKHKSYAVFIKNHNTIKCLFEFTGILNDQLTSIGFFKYGPIGVGIIEQLNKICNVEDTSDFPNVLIENDDLYYKVISEARNFEMTEVQYVKFLGFTLLKDDKEVKPTPVEQNKINKRAEYRAILQEHYLVKDNQVYLKSSDPFYNRLYNNAIRQSPPITLKELLGGLGFKMISVKHLPSDYVPYDWVKDNEGAFDEDDFQSAVESAIIENITIFDKPTDKPEQRTGTDTSRWIRNRETAKRAIISADYCCEYNSDHRHFISQVTMENYVEAHHLVPMGVQDKYRVSIDKEANIISLCVVCHKRLHHEVFDSKRELIEKLFLERESRLKDCGINIGLKELLRYYK